MKVESHNDSNFYFQTEQYHHSPEGCGPYTQMTENLETDHHRKKMVDQSHLLHFTRETT